ncbi:MAG TPA: MOSC N-terminal beta barrel domain-containing protein [Gaiellaceae bacterium]|nr:MOSC N-terminal beta barrel domain-containing protein [Gaiellaceae bacterium]
MAARVVRISIAPVKSLGLVHPDEVELGPGGVPGDRRFWLVDERGRLVNAKQVGSLLAVRPAWDERTGRLELAFPDGRVVAGTVEPGEPVEVEMYGDPLPSRRVEGPWAAALSELAGMPLSLLWSEQGAPDRTLRGGTVSLVSRGSLERLREETGADGPVDGRRFRMLFELDGVDPHAEDGWLGEDVQVGDAVVRVNGDVGRCAVTTRHPDTGLVTLDTLGALARYRREGRTEPLPFGVYGSVLEPGRVRVGARVGVVDAPLHFR